MKTQPSQPLTPAQAPQPLPAASLKSEPLKPQSVNSLPAAEVSAVLANEPARLDLESQQGQANPSLGLFDEPTPRRLPKSPANELRTQLLELPYTIAVALNEAEGDKRYFWEQAGAEGEPEGLKTPYYWAKKSQSLEVKNVYWGASLGAGMLLSYTGSHVANNWLQGESAFQDFNVLDMSRHLFFNVALEDALYWALMQEPVNDTWMRWAAGPELGQTLGENSPLGVPFSYQAALGAFLGGPLHHYRAVHGADQNLLGWGGQSTLGNSLDAAARLSFATGLAVTGLAAASGQPLSDPWRSVGALSLTGGVADGFATLQDGIRRRSLPATLAGAFSLGSSYFQMSTFSAYQGQNLQGMPNDIRVQQVSLPALVLGGLSIGARIWDQSTR